MKNNRISRILSDLQVGLRIDSARLRQLSHDFSVTLHHARDLGNLQTLPEKWHESWNQQWDIVRKILSRIHARMIEVEDDIENADERPLKEARNAWEAIHQHHASLVDILDKIRIQAHAMNEVGRNEWSLLATAFDSNLKTIHACSQAMRVKIELLAGYSKEEVDKIVKGILAKLPALSTEASLATKQYQHELDAAAIELEKEQHLPTGFLDIVKSLLMWVETPDERVASTRSLKTP